MDGDSGKMTEEEMWLRIAGELQELSLQLDAVNSTKAESRQLRQRYKAKLLKLKEQALKNCLKD